MENDLNFIGSLYGVKNPLRKTRLAKYVAARQIYVWFRVFSGAKNKEVTKELGFNHATIHHSLRVVNTMIEIRDGYYTNVLQALFKKKGLDFSELKPIKLSKRNYGISRKTPVRG